MAGRAAPQGSAPLETRLFELVDAGRSWAEAGREVGVPKTTVGTWVRKRQRAA